MEIRADIIISMVKIIVVNGILVILISLIINDVSSTILVRVFFIVLFSFSV